MTNADTHGRRSDDAADAHKKITELHGTQISLLRTDVASLTTGLTNVEVTLNKIGDKIDILSQPNPTNWTGVGSLIVAIVLFLGGVFSFFFKAQANSIEDALVYSSKESELRHEIQAAQIDQLAKISTHIHNRMIVGFDKQEDINMSILKEHAENE